MSKRKNYRKRVVETLETIRQRKFHSSDGGMYVVSGFWTRETRGLIRKFLCETLVIRSVDIRVRDLPPRLRNEALKFCKARSIDHPGNRTLYVLDQDRYDQVNRQLEMQRTPLVVVRRQVKGKKTPDEKLTYDEQQTLDIFPWPADPTL